MSYIFYLGLSFILLGGLGLIVELLLVDYEEGKDEQEEYTSSNQDVKGES